MAYRTSADLFEVGDFISHAGKKLPWKIECDAIRPEWWDGLARMVMDYQDRPFYKAVGIPRGGLPFAQAMNKYASGDPNDQIMICDDVFTTGTSFKDFIKENYPEWTAGQGYRWVIFARKPSNTHPYHVRALFTMPNLPRKI
jgi:hypothetical protein|tara:strand:+ start:593 stop:1018 length:426 start_codon:yes stop_codon:yes gene_type:complete